MASINCDAIGNLKSKLARGRENERLDGAAGMSAFGSETLQNRQHERCSFAGSRLRLRENVAPRDGKRNDLTLHR